jgi:hypothetical protein
LDTSHGVSVDPNFPLSVLLQVNVENVVDDLLNRKQAYDLTLVFLVPAKGTPGKGLECSAMIFDKAENRVLVIVRKQKVDSRHSVTYVCSGQKLRVPVVASKV